MQVEGAHLAVVGWRMVFGEVIAIVVLSAFPIDFESFLANAVTDPIELHVNGF